MDKREDNFKDLKKTIYKIGGEVKDFKKNYLEENEKLQAEIEK